MVYAHEYVDAVVRRSREGMPPYGFVPNWGDAPRPTKFYPDLDVYKLPAPGAPSARDGSPRLQDAFDTPEQLSHAGFTIASLSEMLADSYGRIARRIEINANEDVDKVQSYRLARFSRGTASGGGLYPVSIYWVAGKRASVEPGLYYYSSTQHGIQRLISGDVSGQVTAALQTAGHQADFQDTDQFLLLGLKFWQNAFKYNNFSYHATTMDIGTLVQTWRMWAAARGQEIRPAFWFDEPRLGELIGVREEDEAILAVVPLAWDGGAVEGAPAAAEVRSRTAHTDSERSKEVLRFDMLQAIHADTAAGARHRPAPAAVAPARALPPRTPASVPLECAGFGDTTLRQAIRTRRSSFGKFAANRPVSSAELGALLAAAEAGAGLPCDIFDQSATGLSLVKFHVFVNHVAGVEPGSYEYDPLTRKLALITAGATGNFLQRNYFLNNYNVEQAGAVIVPTIRVDALIDAIGSRGYRLASALTGAVAQAVYTAAAGLGVGCGAALGFDNVSYMEELGLTETREVPLLILMVGHERGHFASCRFDND